ncbi:MAG: site-2 protease family protein, partial [Clostridiales bacterium]|nr:site-2 protease family protein [Clostridiales bacterium]
RGLTLINYILALPGIAFALTIHEYFKALFSYRLGDPYPKLQGRLRANPKSHFEPIGFLLMLLYGYGWGLPVNTSSTYYKNRKSGTIITYAAPSLINLLFAFAAFTLLLAAKQISYTLGLGLPLNSQGFAQSVETLSGYGYTAANLFSPEPILLVVSGTVYQILYMFARCNLAAALINLIPLYPLDAAVILENCLPAEHKYKFRGYRGMTLTILSLLFVSGFINIVFDPVIHLLLRAVE